MTTPSDVRFWPKRKQLIRPLGIECAIRQHRRGELALRPYFLTVASEMSAIWRTRDG